MLLLIAGSVAALLFVIGGLSGAGRIHRLPLLRLGLLYLAGLAAGWKPGSQKPVAVQVIRAS